MDGLSTVHKFCSIWFIERCQRVLLIDANLYRFPKLYASKSIGELKMANNYALKWHEKANVYFGIASICNDISTFFCFFRMRSLQVKRKEEASKHTPNLKTHGRQACSTMAGLVLQLEVLNCYGFTDSWMWKSVNHYVLNIAFPVHRLRLLQPIRFMFFFCKCVCMFGVHLLKQLDCTICWVK